MVMKMEMGEFVSELEIARFERRFGMPTPFYK